MLTPSGVAPAAQGSAWGTKLERGLGWLSPVLLESPGAPAVPGRAACSLPARLRARPQLRLHSRRTGRTQRR